MKASITNPVYSARIVKSDGTTYRLKDITTSLSVNHPKDELAEKVMLSLVNIKVGSSKLIDLISLKDKLYVNANTGSGEKEVFRGFVWSREASESADGNEIQVTGYDRLIYLHKSKDNFFAKAGKKTKDVISTIAKNWGFTISYKYSSITHGKLVYHDQSVADIIIEILNEVKKQTGIDYIIHMSGDTIVIEPVGSNSTVYKLAQKENAVSAYYKQTMEGMITQVLIVKAETTATTTTESSSDSSSQAIITLAKSYQESDPTLSYADAIAKAKEALSGSGSGSSGGEETGRYLTVASVSKNKEKYGTLQEIVVLGKDENVSDAKKEANQTLSDNAQPKEEREVKAIDIPWVKKGDQIYISAGKLNGYFIVNGIEHDSMDGIMYMEVSKYE